MPMASFEAVAMHRTTISPLSAGTLVLTTTTTTFTMMTSAHTRHLRFSPSSLRVTRPDGFCQNRAWAKVERPL